MRIAIIVLTPLLLLLSACGAAEDEPDPATPPVAIWRPDSARSQGAAGDAAPGASTDSGPGVPATGQTAGDASGAQQQDRGSTASGRADARAESPTPSGVSTEASQRADAAPGGESAPDAEAILLRAERAYDAVRTMRADFVQDLTVPLLDTTQRSRGEIFHRKPDRFLMRFSDPAGDVVVADGSSLWLYYPSNDPGQVIRTSMGQAGRIDLQREFLSNPTERFEATVVASENVAGRPAKVLHLVPRTAAPYREVRIWIDERDALARRFRITESNDAVRTVELRNLRVNETLPDDLFTFTPPPTAQVFDQ